MSKMKATRQTKQDQNGHLSKSNYLCNLLFEMAGVAILLLQDERIIDGNRQAATLLGAPQEELLGKTLLEYSSTIQPDGRDSAQTLQCCVNAVLAEQPAQLEWQLQQPNGELVWANMTWSKVELNDEQYLCISLHDITGYKEREETLREEHNLLRFVVDRLPDQIYAKDTEGRFVFANLATAHSLGMDTPAAVEDKTDFDFSPVELAKQFQADDQAFFAEAQPTLYREIEILDKVTNERRWVASNKMLWRDEQDHILGLVGVNHDITDQRRLADQIRQSLTRRERQVQTSTEIAQGIAAAPDLDELFEQVVHLIQSRFEYYHAHVYTLDGDTLVMQAGSGDVGRQLKATQHTISLAAEKSLVAQAARSHQPVLVSDVSQEAGWLPNKLLPQTQTELAVPIKLGEQVLGVLDVQNDAIGSLTEEDQLVLLGLSGQIAVFIENRRAETQRKQTEEALRHREEDIQQLLESSPEAIGVVNTQTGLFESVNANSERLYGLSREELYKVGPGQMSPEFQPDGRPSGEKAMEKIQTALEGDTPVFEWMHCNAQGDDILCEVRLVGLTGERSHLVRFSVTDITDRKAAEETLREREKQFRNTLGNLPIAVAISRIEDGGLLYLNEAFGQLFGGSVDELLKLKAPDFYYEPSDRQKVIEEFSQNGSVDTLEVRFRRVDGRSLAATISIYPIDFLGESVMLSTFYDLTERKRTEIELEARVRELNNLQRLISREDWQEFQAARSEVVQGYWFDQIAIQPIAGENGEIVTMATERSAGPAVNGQALIKPLSVHGEVIGKIGIQDDPDHPLLPEDQEFLETVVEQVAEAMERARLLEQTQKRAVELETVAQVSTEASVTLDTAKLMQTVVDLTKSSFNFYHVHIYLFDDTRNLLVLTAGAGEIGAQMVAEGRTIPFAQKQSLVARAARERQGVIVNDVYADPGFLSHPLLPDTRAEMAISYDRRWKFTRSFGYSG